VLPCFDLGTTTDVTSVQSQQRRRLRRPTSLLAAGRSELPCVLTDNGGGRFYSNADTASLVDPPDDILEAHIHAVGHHLET
jgi:hypothetical protein